MKNDTHRKYMSIAIYSLFVLVAGALLVMLMFTLRDFLAERKYTAIFQVLTPFIYGAVIAYLLNPIMSVYERKVFHKVKARKNGPHPQRMLSLTAAFLSAVVVIGLIALMITPQVGASMNQLAGKITDLFMPAGGAVVSPVDPADTIGPSFLQDADLDSLFGDINLGVDEEWTGYDALMNTHLGVYISDASASVQHFISRFGLKVDIEQSLRDLILSATAHLTVFLGDYFQTIFNATAAIIVTTAKQLLNIIIGVIIAFYILTDKESLFSQIKRLMYAVLPTGFVNKAIEIARTTHRIFGGFIIANLLDSLIVGIICFIFMSLFGINYPMLISVIVAITNVIPFFGPFIGAIPSFMFLAINDVGQGIWFLIFILVLQQIDGNIITPKIVGSSVGLSSFWAIFAILVVSGLMGPIGLFIGVPLFAVVYTLLRDFTANRLKKKGLPPTIGDLLPTDAPPPTPQPVYDDGTSARQRFTHMLEHLSANIHTLVHKTRRPKGGASEDDFYDDDSL